MQSASKTLHEQTKRKRSRGSPDQWAKASAKARRYTKSRNGRETAEKETKQKEKAKQEEAERTRKGRKRSSKGRKKGANNKKKHFFVKKNAQTLGGLKKMCTFAPAIEKQTKFQDKRRNAAQRMARSSIG